MERNIGEIFEYNGEWYQCVNGGCKDCDLSKDASYCNYLIKINFCKAKGIFKKLEKIGEPTIIMGKMVQEFKNNNDNHCEYCCFNKDCNPLEIASICDLHNSFFVELKQNKETMSNTETLWYGPDEKEAKSLKSSNLKSFSLEAAKAGKPICTRDGRKARIICFDFRISDGICMIAAIECGKTETIFYYDLDGKCRGNGNDKYDLMMLPEKKEGWVNVYRSQIYNTLEKAKEAYKRTCNDDNYLQTIKIEWEE